jgi:hypothetical protein
VDWRRVRCARERGERAADEGAEVASRRVQCREEIY